MYTCVHVHVPSKIFSKVRKYFRTFEGTFVVVLSYEGTFKVRRYEIKYTCTTLYESTFESFNVVVRVQRTFKSTLESTKVRKYESTLYFRTFVRNKVHYCSPSCTFESTFEKYK